jgi:hypothetical protein
LPIFVGETYNSLHHIGDIVFIDEVSAFGTTALIEFRRSYIQNSLATFTENALP